MKENRHCRFLSVFAALFIRGSICFGCTSPLVLSGSERIIITYFFLHLKTEVKCRFGFTEVEIQICVKAVEQ